MNAIEAFNKPNHLRITESDVRQVIWELLCSGSPLAALNGLPLCNDSISLISILLSPTVQSSKMIIL